MAFRLGVDVGGTFTDLLLVDEQQGTTTRMKVPSTPDDQAFGVLDGVQRITDLVGTDVKAISHFLHGTTVATNAILERKGARVGLVVTAGFRQVLHIARSFVPGGIGGWINWDPPTPLADLEDTIEVKERIGADGGVVLPVDRDALRKSLETFRGRGVEAVTIALINAYVDDVHELEVREILEEELPGVPVSLSSQILPEIGEYERALGTVANSYVRPVVTRYLDSLEDKLRSHGFKGKSRVIRSDSGLMSFDAAKNKPINLLMSGPAGGVAAAVWFAEQAGYGDLLTLDMGGTSADVALILGGAPSVRRETEIGDLTVLAPSVDVRTVGAGGGSIARVPELTGALRVGPESAGARPGPAAYGHGAGNATVTDANVVLGYLPKSLLGGRMTLDGDAASAVIADIAKDLSVGSEEAASAVFDLVNESMLGALRVVSVQQGHDPRDLALMAFGGAGPLHANSLGELMGSWPVIVPPSPGVLCAYGDATTNPRSEASRSFIRRLSEVDTALLCSELESLRSEAATDVIDAGYEMGVLATSYEVDMRYHGQGFQVPIPVTGGSDGLPVVDLSEIVELLDKKYRRLFSFSIDAEPELVNLRAVVQAPRPDVPVEVLEAATTDPDPAWLDDVQVYCDGRWLTAGSYDRSRLLAGNVVPGPAVIAEMDSTTLVLPKHVAEIDQIGNILIWPEDHVSRTVR